jgi:hypothetical protein
MQQGDPSEPVAIARRQPRFVGDEVIQGPDPFAVTPGLSIVGAQGSHELEDPFGDSRRVRTAAGLSRAFKALSEAAGGAGPQGE